MADESLLTIKALRKRGWTPYLIARLLGKPDLPKGNVHFAKVPMGLYQAPRVAAVEQTPEFIAAQAKVQARPAAAKWAIELQHKTLLRLIDAMVVTVQRVPVAQARRHAGGADKTWNRTEVEHAAPQHSLDWITVNYIRQRLTQYDAMLEAMARRIGMVLAMQRIRLKLLAAIAVAYPDLAAECDRQATPTDFP